MSIRTAGVVLSAVLAVQPATPQAPPRDPKPAQGPAEAMSAVAARVAALAEKGQLEEAEGVLNAALKTHPRDRQLLLAAAALYNRKGDFAKTIDAAEAFERASPGDREAPHRVATFYWEKAFRDQSLADAQKRQYLAAGVAASDRALAIDPDYVDALIYKNILKRLQATLEQDTAVSQQLIAEADALRTRAQALRKEQTGAVGGGWVPGSAPSPPGPPPPDPGAGGMAPVRVGGNIPVPQKIRDASPVYPSQAQSAGIEGMVICEITIGVDGTVTNARVLRSVPLLDEAALQTVRQWVFQPTYFNGRAVPVLMTAPVSFRLK